MKQQRLCFYTPAVDETALAADFGCATLGFCTADGWVLPTQAESATLPVTFEGAVFTGSYAACKQAIAEARHTLAAVKVGIVLFGNAGGEEDFLSFLIATFPAVPFVGGSPAIGENGVVGRMCGGPAQVSIFLITDDRYDFTVTAAVPHEEAVERLTVLGDAPRAVERVRRADGSEATFAEVLDAYAATYGVTQHKTERLAVNDGRGRNMHLVSNGDRYTVGANLPTEREVELRHVSYEQAYARMQAFYRQEHSLVFGCAGLKGLLRDNRIFTMGDSLGLFLFGEVITNQDGPQFANLSLSKLTWEKKM